MEERKLHIGYFADGLWAHEAFERFIKDKTIIIDFICLRFGNKDSVLCELAAQFQIQVFCVQNINDKDFIEKMRKINSDLFVSMSFDQIFKRELFELPRYKTINCHAGKLPFYRGRNVLNWVLINDEKEFGITVHYVDEGIDTGDIILQEVYPITEGDDYGTLLRKAYTGCADILYQAIKLIQNDAVTRIRQNSIDSVGLYCGQRTVGDEIINWNQSSRNIFNFIRALTRPGVGATSYINGKQVKIYKAQLIEGAHEYINIPGQILMKEEDGFIVKTKDTIIKITDYEYDGKIKAGTRFNVEK